MKQLLAIFAILFVGGCLFTTSWATEQPKTNEMEEMLKRIKQSTQAVGQATKQAKQVSAELVEKKVAEKAELKEAVVQAEAKITIMEQVQEVFVSKMMAAGIDTAMTEVVDEGKNAGAIFDAFLEYQKNGGTEDFNWFRLYIYK